MEIEFFQKKKKNGSKNCLLFFQDDSETWTFILKMWLEELIFSRKKERLNETNFFFERD